MASLTPRENGGYWIQFRHGDGKRRTLRLPGKPTKRVAQEVQSRVERILSATASNTALDAETAAWLSGVGDDLYRRLVGVDLVEPRATTTLDAFAEEYIAGRTSAAPRTRVNAEQTRRQLADYFGIDRDLRSITPADADAWAEWMTGRYRPSTAGRAIRRAQEFGRAAVRKRIVDASPFEHLKSSSAIDRTRQAYVDLDLAARVLDALPPGQCRLAFALARLAGLRVPSELAVLRWEHVDLPRGVLGVDAPKTGFRTLPISPELRPHLEAAWDAAAEGESRVFPAVEWDTNMGQDLTRRLKAAGIVPWPKLYHTLRASCQSDWLREYPIHHVCKWLGNSPVVALTHYARVSDEDTLKAAQEMASRPKQKAKQVEAKSEEPPVSTGKPGRLQN